MFSDQNNKHIKSALQFLAAVGTSYCLVWALASFASSGKKRPLLQHGQLQQQEQHHGCARCISKIAALEAKRDQLPHQSQLILSILTRLLRDRGVRITADSTNNDNSNNNECSSSSCTCNTDIASVASGMSTCLRVPLPCISVNPACEFHSLATPAHFYATLLEKISSAQRRIVITSLYIGSGPRSKRLVEALRNKIKETPGLEVLIVLDYCRMHIGPNLDAIRPIVEQIEETQQQQGKHQQQEQQIVLFCPPSAVGLMFRKFGRVREAQGVQHTKLFVFDDDVILSGANLSDDYFLDRMDRYLLLNGAKTNGGGCKALADHMACFARTLASTSFELFPAWSQRREHTSKLCCNGKMRLANNAFGFDSDQPADDAKEIHATVMRDFEAQTSVPLRQWVDALEMMHEQQQDNNALSFVIPSVQYARAGVFTDMSVLESLLSFDASAATTAATTIVQRIVASPYLNTHTSFLDQMFSVCEQRKKQRMLFQSVATAPTTSKKSARKGPEAAIVPAFRFVTCSPNSNAWKGSAGAAGGLPQLYYSLVRSFFFLVEDRGYGALVDTREFEKHHLVNPTNGEYIEMPEGATANAFSPYVRPDDEEKPDDEKNGNNKKQERDFPDKETAVSTTTATAVSPQTHCVASATFHAKGMWMLAMPAEASPVELLLASNGNSPVASINANNTSSSAQAASFNSTASSSSSAPIIGLPFATVVGSNNLGERCVYKDLEFDFVVVTSDPKVQTVLSGEVGAILQHSRPVSREGFVSNGDGLGRFQPVVEVVGSMMSSYL